MKINTEFTKEELVIIDKALFLGIIHSDEDDVVRKFEELSMKIKMVGSIMDKIE